jgi:hypothetical protein
MKQITEDYVNSEIAQLLQEKGFDIPCRQAYFNGSLVDYTMYGFCDGKLLDCPTQHIAIKWLKELYSIYITSEPDINDKHCFYPAIYTMTEESWDMQSFEELEKLSFDKPEQAVDAAILYVLKNLI